MLNRCNLLLLKQFIFSLLDNVMKIAVNIASKSPVGVQMTKRSIIYSRDHTVQEGLDHIVRKQVLFINFQ